MDSLQVLFVAGTHGNEINAPWLMEEWAKNPDLINSCGLNVISVIGNPQAFKEGKRYLDFDLNRCFCDAYLSSNDPKIREVVRAKELLNQYGPKGSNPCQIVFDFHSTTSNMGSSLVVYGRRSCDLALASLIQGKLGLPIYLHEGDCSQTGFLVESWQCGLVLEIGPVSQNQLSASIIEKNRIAIEASMACIASICSGNPQYPSQIIVHIHKKSLDFPRDNIGKPQSYIHPFIDGRDWSNLQEGDPIFIGLDGEMVAFAEKDYLVPVFINESAYVEKKIAMSLTKREVWEIDSQWKEDLEDLVIANRKSM